MKKFISLILCLIMVIPFLSSCAKGIDRLKDGKVFFAKIDVKDYGVITVQLDHEQAPITVENFVKLAEDGFYDGLTFHRIMSGFMIQGGAPNSTGASGSPKTIKGEFSKNGVNNTIEHTRGVISMARTQVYDSASSQFFIVHADAEQLNGLYAGFGYVVDGMSVVDSICDAAVPTDTNGTIHTTAQPIINSIEISIEDPIVIDGNYTPEAAEELKFTPTHSATITIKDYGTIELELYGEEAPITVENFVKLANQGFYDGLTFHRIMEGFMIQGGDPDGNGTGGSDENIKGEFSSNGVKNRIKHIRGTISMARSGAPDSASSQFFIVHETSGTNSASLDGNYAAFGMVTKGMEVVDDICDTVEVTDNDGTVASGQKPIIESITVQAIN